MKTELLVEVAVGLVVLVQIYFFVKNLIRMFQYQNIFSQEESWKLTYNQSAEFVNGIDGEGNDVFYSIKNSINKYLGNNQGSVIDFHLLKDSVDRHCDAVENDIHTLTPTPLYCGLAGTMFGVIVGLFSLIQEGAISSLLTGGVDDEGNNFQPAADGVDELLTGVALAMVASIFGIVLTTISSVMFKKCKQKEEAQKNGFLAWLQSCLLPALSTDTSQALTNLVRNLNRFNKTFAQNTRSLGDALSNVNESYRIQGDIIKAVHDMDVVKVSESSVSILKELEKCSPQLNQFARYLDGVKDYTTALQEYTEGFKAESERLHVLEEIRDYFQSHKASISQTVADSDRYLKDALEQLRDSATTQINSLNLCFVQQAENFKRFLQEERESFEQHNNQIKESFDSELSKVPSLVKRLEEISAIPEKLKEMTKKVEESNQNMAESFVLSLQHLVEEQSKVNVKMTIPSSLKWTIITLLAMILLVTLLIFSTQYL